MMIAAIRRTSSIGIFLGRRPAAISRFSHARAWARRSAPSCAGVLAVFRRVVRRAIRFTVPRLAVHAGFAKLPEGQTSETMPRRKDRPRREPPAVSHPADRLFPEPDEAASELGTTYDADPATVKPLPKPAKPFDWKRYRDAIIRIPKPRRD